MQYVVATAFGLLVLVLIANLMVDLYARSGALGPRRGDARSDAPRLTRGHLRGARRAGARRDTRRIP
ncbi:MAG: hypothetical protein M5T61_12050 [Acidimicrobiia bacterium]|nr:hypothetical protein [Acidimicrobiia bacterium]